jgi:hypothetical protein
MFVVLISGPWPYCEQGCDRSCRLQQNRWKAEEKREKGTGIGVWQAEELVRATKQRQRLNSSMDGFCKVVER